MQFYKVVFFSFLILFCWSGLTGKEFDYFSAYDIDYLHKLGLTGKDTSIAILETSVNPNHPALKDKIEIVEPLLISPNQFYEHGNHVSAIAVGNKTKEFMGGIAKDAKGYLIVKTIKKKNNDLQGVLGDMLIVFAKAAEKAHIINLSGGILTKMLEVGRAHLTPEFLDELNNILTTNDALLVITASNDGLFINNDSGLRYLADLLKHTELMKRVVIIGNLGFKSYADIKKLIDENEELMGIHDAMASFINEDESLLRPKTSFYGALLKELDEKQKDLLEIKLQKYLGFRKHQYFSDLVSKIEVDSFKELVIKELNEKEKEYENLKFTTEEIKELLKEDKQESYDIIYNTALELSKKYDYIDKDIIKNNIKEHIVKNIKTIKLNDLENTIENYLSDWFFGKRNFSEALSDMANDINFKRNRLPNLANARGSGYIVSAMAGLAKDHFVMVYGQDINSAWSGNGYSIQSGSSQAAPIASGLLTLFHQYKNQKMLNINYADLLAEFKKATRQLGDPEYFGLGMLDVKKLFPDLLPLNNKDYESVYPKDIVDHAQTKSKDYDMECLKSQIGRERLSLTLTKLRLGEVPSGILDKYYKGLFINYNANAYAKSVIAHFVCETGGFRYSE